MILIAASHLFTFPLTPLVLIHPHNITEPYTTPYRSNVCPLHGSYHLLFHFAKPGFAASPVCFSFSTSSLPSHSLPEHTCLSRVASTQLPLRPTQGCGRNSYGQHRRNGTQARRQVQHRAITNKPLAALLSSQLLGDIIVVPPIVVPRRLHGGSSFEHVGARIGWE